MDINKPEFLTASENDVKDLLLWIESKKFFFFACKLTKNFFFSALRTNLKTEALEQSELENFLKNILRHKLDFEDLSKITPSLLGTAVSSGGYEVKVKEAEISRKFHLQFFFFFSLLPGLSQCNQNFKWNCCDASTTFLKIFRENSIPRRNFFFPFALRLTHRFFGYQFSSLECHK